MRFESAPRHPAEFIFTGIELLAALAQQTAATDHLIWLASRPAQVVVGIRLSTILSFYDADEQTMLDQQRANLGGFKSRLQLRSGLELKLFATAEDVAQKLAAADAAETWDEVFIGVEAQDPVGVVHISSRHVERITGSREVT